jgi:hypothetical protein
MHNVILRCVRATIAAVKKTIIIRYSECVLVAMRIRLIVICRLTGSTTFFHIIIRILRKRYRTRNEYFDFLYNFV